MKRIFHRAVSLVCAFAITVSCGIFKNYAFAEEVNVAVRGRGIAGEQLAEGSDPSALNDGSKATACQTLSNATTMGRGDFVGVLLEGDIMISSLIVNWGAKRTESNGFSVEVTTDGGTTWNEVAFTYARRLDGLLSATDSITLSETVRANGIRIKKTVANQEYIGGIPQDDLSRQDALCCFEFCVYGDIVPDTTQYGYFERNKGVNMSIGGTAVCSSGSSASYLNDGDAETVCDTATNKATMGKDEWVGVLMDNYYCPMGVIVKWGDNRLKNGEFVLECTQNGGDTWIEADYRIVYDEDYVKENEDIIEFQFHESNVWVEGVRIRKTVEDGSDHISCAEFEIWHDETCGTAFNKEKPDDTYWRNLSLEGVAIGNLTDGQSNNINDNDITTGWTSDIPSDNNTEIWCGIQWECSNSVGGIRFYFDVLTFRDYTVYFTNDYVGEDSVWHPIYGYTLSKTYEKIDGHLYFIDTLLSKNFTSAEAIKIVSASQSENWYGREKFAVNEIKVYSERSVFGVYDRGPGGNLALGGAYVASTEYGREKGELITPDERLECGFASNATDGDLYTCWQDENNSYYSYSIGVEGEWIAIDMDGVREIEKIRLIWCDNRPDTYEEGGFSILIDTTPNEGHFGNFAEVECIAAERYQEGIFYIDELAVKDGTVSADLVQVLINSSSYGGHLELCEVEIYGPDNSFAGTVTAETEVANGEKDIFTATNIDKDAFPVGMYVKAHWVVIKTVDGIDYFAEGDVYIYSAYKKIDLNGIEITSTDIKDAGEDEYVAGFILKNVPEGATVEITFTPVFAGGN